MTNTSAFKSPEGEAAYLAAYEAGMKLWPVPYEEIEISTRFGMTHVVASGPKDAPPLVLLHGYFGTLIMWTANIADFSTAYRVYAVDVMGQPSKSIPDPDKPIRDADDYVAWLSEKLDGLNLDRIFLVGLSYGGWLALDFTMKAPERVEKLALLSPAACFQANTRQFNLRGLLMGLFPTRFTLNACFGWMGYEDAPDDRISRSMLDLVYLGIKHFRFPPGTTQIMPSVYFADELGNLDVPVLLLMGENEVMYDAAAALARAHRLVPNLEGEVVPGCNHEMHLSQSRIVDARVLDFLDGN